MAIVLIWITSIIVSCIIADAAAESIVATAKICRFCSAAQAVNEWPTS